MIIRMRLPKTTDMKRWPRLVTFLLCSLLPALLFVSEVFASEVFANEVSAQESLAIAQDFEVNGDHEAALAAYLQLVATISSADGEFSSELFEPLMGLSRTYLATDSPGQATKTLRHAQHIAHRNDGVYSPRQSEIVDLLTRIALDAQQPLEADRQQGFQFFLGTHQFAGSDALPAHIKQGEWFIETGQYNRARKILQQAITLIVEAGDESDLRQLQPLRLIAKARRLQGRCCGEKQLEKALEIIAENSDIPGDLHADVYFELGDAYTLRGKSAEAARLYLKAWQSVNDGQARKPEMIVMSDLLHSARSTQKRTFRIERDAFGTHRRMRQMTQDEEIVAEYQSPQFFLVPLEHDRYGLRIRDSRQASPTHAKTEKMVGTPFQFAFAQLQNILPRSRKSEVALAAISIALDFTVTGKGAIRDIEIIKSNAPAKLNRLMGDVLRKARFRPALVDGQPIVTQNVTITETFPLNHSAN